MDALKLTERHLEQKASEILEDARRLRTPLGSPSRHRIDRV
jgi:hypothetical protein